MQYLLMIYSAEDSGPQPGDADFSEYMQAYMTFTRETQEAGVFVAGEPLEKISTATTVRVRNGDTLLTDGPFAETKEQLGGFYIVEAADLDEAIALAKRIPAASTGCVEVRPVWTMGD